MNEIRGQFRYHTAVCEELPHLHCDLALGQISFLRCLGRWLRWVRHLQSRETAVSPRDGTLNGNEKEPIRCFSIVIS